MKASPRARARNDTKAAQNRIEILEQGFDRHALALAEAYDDLEAARAVEEDVIENRPLMNVHIDGLVVNSYRL